LTVIDQFLILTASSMHYASSTTAAVDEVVRDRAIAHKMT